jgi:hypothetical protein
MTDKKTVFVVVLVLAAILFIYLNTPNENINNAPVVVVDAENKIPDLVNASHMSGYWSGKIAGQFDGKYTQTNNYTLRNVVGQFNGKCDINNTMVFCAMNVTEGKFEGLFEGSQDATGTYHLKNVRGQAKSWKIEGVYASAQETKEAESFDWNILLYIGAGVLIIVIVTKVYGQEESWSVLDSADIAEKAREWLQEKWSINVNDVEEIVYVDKENPQWAHIHVRLDRPKYENILLEYDFKKKAFTKYKRRATYSDISSYMKPRIEYVEERTMTQKQKRGMKAS